MSEPQAAGAMAMPAHGEFCWTEIASTDLEKCMPFYSNVFGWQFEQSKATASEMPYLEFSSGSAGFPDGALYEMTEEMYGGQIPPAHIALYVSVDDVDASSKQAEELGGSIVFGPYDIPNVGRFAIVNDPTGAAISMITLKS